LFSFGHAHRLRSSKKCKLFRIFPVKTASRADSSSNLLAQGFFPFLPHRAPSHAVESGFHGRVEGLASNWQSRTNTVHGAVRWTLGGAFLFLVGWRRRAGSNKTSRKA
jgi:hypothetical protein